MSVWVSRFEAMGFLDNLLNHYTPRTPGEPVFAVIDTETTGFNKCYDRIFVHRHRCGTTPIGVLDADVDCFAPLSNANQADCSKRTVLRKAPSIPARDCLVNIM